MTNSENRTLAQRHLFPHFTTGKVWRDPNLPIIVSGEGCYLIDEDGNRFLDGLAGLFCVNMGHGRTDIPAAATKQMSKLAYWTNWGSAHPAAVEAAKIRLRLPAYISAVTIDDGDARDLEAHHQGDRLAEAGVVVITNRKIPEGKELAPPPPKALRYIAFQSAQIPARTRDG